MKKNRYTCALEQIKTVCEHCYFDCEGPEHNDYYVLDRAIQDIEEIVKKALQENEVQD